MAIIASELLEKFWRPEPVKGATLVLARFINRSWGKMSDQVPLEVLKGLTADPEEYNPLTHPDVTKMQADFIQYTRFLQRDLTDPVKRQIVINVLTDAGSIGVWRHDQIAYPSLPTIGSIRHPLETVEHLSLIHPRTMRFLQTAARLRSHS